MIDFGNRCNCKFKTMADDEYGDEQE
jgi:hypothetical protein